VQEPLMYDDYIVHPTSSQDTNLCLQGGQCVWNWTPRGLRWGWVDLRTVG